MESNAATHLKQLFFCSTEGIDFDFSDDENDGQPENIDEVMDFTLTKPEGDANTDAQNEKTSNEAPLQDIKHEPTVQQIVTIKEEIQDNQEKSLNSSFSNGITPRRSSRSSRGRHSSLKTPGQVTLSTEAVTLLSDPLLLHALQVFQGAKQGQSEDMDILGNPRIVRALRTLHSITTPIDDSSGSLTGQFVPLTSTPTDSQSSQLIQPENMKKEGVRPKRKLSDLEAFTSAWKHTPKKPRRTRQADNSSITQSIGSPTRIMTKDSTSEDLLKMQSLKVASMNRLDTLLKKNPSANKTLCKNTFFKVTSLFNRVVFVGHVFFTLKNSC